MSGLHKLTIEQIEEAFRNSQYEPPSIKVAVFEGTSHGIATWKLFYDIENDEPLDMCIWVYIREQNGKLYVDL